MQLKKFSPLHSWLLAGVNLVLIGLVATLGPAEKSLGVNVRVVYLHGAWVWAALASFVAAGLIGATALILRRPGLYAWSTALGWTGLLFWVTYLPLSLWAMQTNWNGLFLVEPRWRLAIAFAGSGLALQVGLALINRPSLTAFANIAFITAMVIMLNKVQDVMHPASPIADSEARWIQIFFALLLALTLLMAFQVAFIWRSHLKEQPR
jgi:hypothetical protein